MDRPGHLNLLHIQHTELNPFSRPTTPGQNATQIAFVGLGAMGYPMARNLARWRQQHVQGFLPLLVWNRSRGKAEDLVKELSDNAITIADSLEQVATEADIIITNLSNDDVVRSVYQAFAKALHVRAIRSGHRRSCALSLSLQESKPTRTKTFVESSTIYPTLAGMCDNDTATNELSCSYRHS